MSKLVFLLIISLIFFKGQCDLPVHCLKRQIVGDWRLEMTGTLAKGEEKCPCGHDIPDKASTSFLAMEDSFTSKQEILVNLEGNDEVYDQKNRNNKGTWTMIYDEGFEITLNNVKFFAFSKYVKTNSYSYQSECGKTLVGWWYNENTKEKGCYRALKTSSDSGEKALTDNVHQDKVVQPKFLQLTSNQMAQTDNKNQDSLILDKQFKEHQKVVDRLNSIKNKKWKAAIPPNFAELNLEQLNKHAGRRKYQFYTEDTQKNRVLLPSFIQTASEREFDNFQHFSRYDLSSLPKEFTWGQYLEPPIQQRDCGSCYVISTVEMLQARLKIKHNDHTKLSIQNMINCNYFNQGCDGGYPFLVEKYANEFSFLPESCGGSYQGADGMCNNKCSASEKQYKAANYRYLGGAYGKSNEKIMMEEVMNNGPIAVSFEPGYDFMYYSSGIYHSVDAEDWIKNHEQQPNWEKVDHSVLLYGWGEEQGEKYWLVQNSWGDQWGENGYFRIRRGTDESHIESMGEASDPVIVNGSSQQHSSYIEEKEITQQESSYKNSRNNNHIYN